jgi:Peptidogalycan biosysnthesis/recognition
MSVRGEVRVENEPRAVYHGTAELATQEDVLSGEGSVDIVSRAELMTCEQWKVAFNAERKDHRFYELVEDTICQGFDYRYFVLRSGSGDVRAVQPFFILDQDLLAGISPRLRRLVRSVRCLWPRFLKMRTLMVGCAVGEGHLDGEEKFHGSNARLLAQAIVAHARDMNAPLVVLKEFPARYRDSLKCFSNHGFIRVPSLPMTRLNIDYPSFEAYMMKALNSATRRKLRKKFRAAADSSPITMGVVDDIAPIVDNIYPLYLQVYDRSRFHFEKLTKAFLCGLGRRMPNKVRFFLWSQNGRIVAFTLCMIERDAIFVEYIGLDYSVALDLHLYHYAVRDMISWGIAHGFKWLRSSGLNYDPKLHLRHVLDPVDLYVRHTLPISNAVLKWLLPLIEPTRFDPVLRKFPNYDELWGPPCIP